MNKRYSGRVIHPASTTPISTIRGHGTQHGINNYGQQSFGQQHYGQQMFGRGNSMGGTSQMNPAYPPPYVQHHGQQMYGGVHAMGGYSPMDPAYPSAPI